MHNRLLTVVALLTSAVIGCDDPEVQDKIGQVIQYGAVIARVRCNFDESSAGGPSGSPALKTNVTYTAALIADGSCLVTVSADGVPSLVSWNSAHEGVGCEIKFHDDPFGPYSSGNSWANDVSRYNYKDDLEVKFCKPAFNDIPSNPPFYTPVCPWISTCPDAGCTTVTLSALGPEICTGFNLEAFDTSP